MGGVVELEFVSWLSLRRASSRRSRKRVRSEWMLHPMPRMKRMRPSGPIIVLGPNPPVIGVGMGTAAVLPSGIRERSNPTNHPARPPEFNQLNIAAESTIPR